MVQCQLIWSLENGKERTHWFKEATKRLVRNSIPQWHIDRVSFAFSPPSVLLCTRPREEITKLVKTTSHDAVSGVKSLFNAVSVMRVNVNV